MYHDESNTNLCELTHRLTNVAHSMLEWLKQKVFRVPPHHIDWIHNAEVINFKFSLHVQTQ